METQTTAVNWDSVQEPGTDFVKFADKQANIYAVKNWKLETGKEKKFGTQTNPPEMVDKIKFTCEVVGIDGKLTKKVISTSSSRFLNAIKPCLKDKSPSSIVFVRIKRIGIGNATAYDIEPSQPTELGA